MKSLAADMSRKEASALARASRAMERDVAQPPNKTAPPDAAAATAAATQARTRFDDVVAATKQGEDETVLLATTRQALTAFDAFTTAYNTASPFYVLARRNDFATMAAAAHASGDQLIALGKVSKPFFLASRARKGAYQTLTDNAALAQTQLAELDELGRGAVAGNDLRKISDALSQAATIKAKLNDLLVSSSAASATYSK